MFCRKCGNELPDTAEFCGKCGAKVNEEVKPKDNMSIMLISLILIVLGLISPFLPLINISSHLSAIMTFAGYDNKGFSIIRALFDSPVNDSVDIVIIAIYMFFYFLGIVSGIVCIILALQKALKKEGEKTVFRFWELSLSSSLTIFIANLVIAASFSTIRLVIYNNEIQVYEVDPLLYAFEALALVNYVIAHVPFSRLKKAAKEKKNS
ncbi:MAG: zinc ribbon domain-containing protein [Ruminococcus sp.]|nr:zinc ribbon domain-containing protein [Ruminococcus sp.]